MFSAAHAIWLVLASAFTYGVCLLYSINVLHDDDGYYCTEERGHHHIIMIMNGQEFRKKVIPGTKNSCMDYY